jgi:hypothetical protein
MKNEFFLKRSKIILLNALKGRMRLFSGGDHQMASNNPEAPLSGGTSILFQATGSKPLPDQQLSAFQDNIH